MSAGLALAGCGSNSSSSSSAASTPATTSTTTSVGTSTTPGTSARRVPKSAVIASGAYYNALVAAFDRSLRSSAKAQFAARCIQQGLEAAGFKTQGDTEGANTNKALSVVIPCLQQARSH